MWNNDWDGAPLVIDDYLFEGGENSQFHIVKLNRGVRARRQGDGHPAARLPRARLGSASCCNDIGDNDVSIENSVAIVGQHGVLRELGRARAGMGHLGARDGRHADARLPVLDR